MKITYRTNARLSTLRMEWHDLKGEVMERRGSVAEELFREFVGALPYRNVRISLP